MSGVWCLEGRRRARALFVSCVWTVAEGRVRYWCLVSGRSPKGACAVGVWCLEGRRRARALLVSGVWTVAEGRVRCWCLVSVGCFSLVRPLFWGVLQMTQMQHGVL